MAREEVEVAFNIELETRKVSNRLAGFDREIRKTSKHVEELGAIGKSLGKSYAVELNKARSSVTQFQKVAERSSKQILKARQAAASATTQAEKKAAKEQIAYHRKQIEEARSAMKEAKAEFVKGVGSTKFGDVAKGLVEKGFKPATSTLGKLFREPVSEFTKELASETKDALQEGFDSFKGKDLSGMIKGAGKLGSSLLKGVGGYGGAALTKGGAKMQAKGADMGGGAGAALKVVGSVMGKMGPMLGMLAKLGPLLSTSAAIFAGLVKVMLDAEAAAKGMNKEILESASSAETLYKNGGNAQKGFKDLDSTLDSIRDHATDTAQNLKYGMKAEDVINVTKAFTQQGVSLESLKQSFKNAGDAAETSAAQIQDFGDLARMSFVYSRMMGVSLSEITEMQGEMFTEMGTSLSGIKLQFATMTKDAVESGIATNKFFNIIRGISADLALYTTRMGQATTMLKVLGKVMNPREAQKFMQTAVQGLKQMGEEDRIRLTLLAGEGKMRDVITKDLNRKTQLAYADLASASGATLQEVKDAAAKGGQDLEKILEKVAPNQRAAFKSALAEIKMDKNAMQKGGLVGTSEAASNLSAAGALTATKAALQRFGGKGKLSDMTGIQAMAARKAAGVSLEQFRAMAKMEQAVDEQKETMASLFKKRAEGKELSKADKDQIARLEALGITSEAQLKAADDADIIAAMEQGTQDALAAAAEQKDYAAETAKATTSIVDKMESIIEGIFEFLYVALKDVISDLNEFINLVAEKFGKERPEKKARDTLREIKDEKNEKLVNSLQRALAAEGPGDAKTKLIGAIGPALQKGMAQAADEQKKTFEAAAIKEAETAKGAKLTEEEMSAAIKKGQEAYNKSPVQRQLGAKQADDISSVLGYGLKQDSARIQSVVGMTDIDQAKKAKFTEAMGQGKDFWSAGEAAGFTAEDMQKFLAKSVWGMKPDELARVAPKLQTVQAGFDAKKNRPDAAAAAPAPTGQQAAAAKAAAPGSGVTAAPAASTPAAAAPATPAAPTQPAAPTTSSVAVAPPPTKGEQAIVEQLGDSNIDVVNSLKDLWSLMSQKGIKLQQSWMDTKYKEVIEKGALEAIRKGLFEYAMYTAADPQKLIDRMKGSGFEEVGKMATTYADDPAHAGFLQKNAQGGIVTSVAGGLAKIEAAPGEGLASIGPGERILPAGAGGGGGGGVTVNVNGIGGADLANYLKGKIADAIYEYKRREKFT